MNDFSKKIVSHFYEEALKHKIYSEEFVDNSKKVSKMYMDNFGMSQIWLDYHKILFENEAETRRLLKVMYLELLKL